LVEKWGRDKQTEHWGTLSKGEYQSEKNFGLFTKKKEYNFTIIL